MICPKCEHELSVGEWPWCPHGHGTYTNIPDDIPSGMVMDHVEPGRRVYSKSELKRVLASHGYRLSEGHVTTPGTDKNPHTTRWV